MLPFRPADLLQLEHVPQVNDHRNDPGSSLEAAIGLSNLAVPADLGVAAANAGASN
jgi:hypothetical protein